MHAFYVFPVSAPPDTNKSREFIEKLLRKEQKAVDAEKAEIAKEIGALEERLKLNTQRQSECTYDLININIAL